MTNPVGSVRSPQSPSIPKLTSPITQIALRCLKELTISSSLAYAISFFVAPASVPILIQAVAIQSAASLLFHTVGAIAHAKGANRLRSFCEWMTGANFALLTGYNSQILIHEAGHALAAASIYTKAHPQIELIPFHNAITHSGKGALTSFGKMIGSANATCLIVASGPLLTLAVSTLFFSIGMSMKEKHPQLGKYLISWALLDFAHSAQYAYSAIGARSFNLSHDFIRLSLFGISPVAATVGIAAIPVIIGTGFYFCK